MATIFFDHPTSGDSVSVGAFQGVGHIDPAFPGPNQVQMQAWISLAGQVTQGTPVLLPQGANVTWKFNMVVVPAAAGKDVWYSVKLFPPDGSQPVSSSVLLHVNA